MVVKFLRAFSFILWWILGLNSGLHICKASALLLESHLQTILLWLVFGDGVLQTVWAGLEL
jgi:hypothetical protein